MAGSTLQTEGQKQFRLNRQVLIVLGAMMIALALPLGGVNFDLAKHHRKAGSGARAKCFGRSANHAGRHPTTGWLRHSFQAARSRSKSCRGLRPQKERIERLSKSYGGIAVPTSESESEIRLLIRVPDEHLQEFLRAVQNKESKQLLESGGLLEVVLTRTGLE